MRKYIERFFESLWEGVLAIIGFVLVVVGCALIIFPIFGSPVIIATGLTLMLGPKGYRKFKKRLIPWIKNHKIRRKRL